MIAGMALLSLSFALLPSFEGDRPETTTSMVGASPWAFVAIAAMVVFCSSYALGLGNVAWVVQSEVRCDCRPLASRLLRLTSFLCSTGLQPGPSIAGKRNRYCRQLDRELARLVNFPRHFEGYAPFRSSLFFPLRSTDCCLALRSPHSCRRFRPLRYCSRRRMDLHLALRPRSVPSLSPSPPSTSFLTFFFPQKRKACHSMRSVPCSKRRWACNRASQMPMSEEEEEEEGMRSSERRKRRRKRMSTETARRSRRERRNE